MECYKGGGWMGQKLDMQNAYDKVELFSIIQTLKLFGLKKEFVN